MLDRCLADSPFIAGEEYTIADMAIFSWYGGLVKSWLYSDKATFLNVQDYPHLRAWAD
ncbi:glutathione S-transferase C-terminal domain-containing protein [Acetobacter malorum]|uniref:glutathione S-transferase C-terminal domain-containing protein n=1 Tax=Acetobacter malorum TaxID=178901 RepID=UPI0039EAC0AC